MKNLKSLKTSLIFTLLMKLLVAASPATAAPPASATVSLSQELTEVESTLTRLSAPLELMPDEIVYLNKAAMQLNDSSTGKPYETVGHHLLPYYVLDSEAPASAAKTKTVLFIGSIHANEIDPMVTVWRLLLELANKKESLAAGVRLIYAPLTNPDGLINSTQLHGFPTRENLHGVDLNRNFAHGSPEVETHFLMDLIANFKPEAIVSLHAPFDWLDYNGPAKAPGASADTVRAVQDWLNGTQGAALKKIPINPNFETYPGSLGEYAGTKLKIHTLTYEYPTMWGNQGQSDWKMLGPSVLRSLGPP